jgi:hypothetical protein
MTIRPSLRVVVAGALFLLASPLILGCSIEPGEPPSPTYEAHVRPILMARCGRCHGDPPLGDALSLGGARPGNERFDLYDDTNTTCPTGDGGTIGCVVMGAKSYAVTIAAYIVLKPEEGGMPPLPAPRLTSYQIDTITRWASVSPPLER